MASGSTGSEDIELTGVSSEPAQTTPLLPKNPTQSSSGDGENSHTSGSSSGRVEQNNHPKSTSHGTDSQNRQELRLSPFPSKEEVEVYLKKVGVQTFFMIKFEEV